MPINSCSSCTSSNIATQYAEQLMTKLQDRSHSTKTDANALNPSGSTSQDGVPTINGQGEPVGAQVNTSA
jgi:hypothetical protein